MQSDDSALLIGEPSEWKSCLKTAIDASWKTLFFPAIFPGNAGSATSPHTIRSTTIVDWGKLDSSSAIFCLVQVEYETGKADRYFMPMATAFGSTASTLRDSAAASILSAVLSPSGEGVLYDATYDIGSCQELLSVIENSTTSALQLGTVKGASSSALPGLLAETTGPEDKALAPHRSSAEQSNTSVLFGDRLILKLFRHPEPGLNPDCEIGRFLTEEAHFANVAPFGGSIEYIEEAEVPTRSACCRAWSPIRAMAGSGCWKNWSATTKATRRRWCRRKN